MNCGNSLDYLFTLPFHSALQGGEKILDHRWPLWKTRTMLPTLPPEASSPGQHATLPSPGGTAKSSSRGQ